MKIAYFDCFSGVSGDMTLGALLACAGFGTERGGDIEQRFRTQLDALGVPGYELNIQTVKREGITAVDVDVTLIEDEQGHGRHLSAIADILSASRLSETVKSRALAVFTRLADAEAKIHGTSREEIHFHEVGAVDAIVDIVGSCILLEMLGVEQVATSPFPCGTGTIWCQHGIMPVPAPATMELFAGFPIYSVDIRGELVTPTGAALITTLADPKTAGRMPAMRIEASGYGSGKKQFKRDMPNLLRILIGESVDTSGLTSYNQRARWETQQGNPTSDHGQSADATPQVVSILETNLDDASPETYDLLMERAFAAGALDVFFTPIQMKKNRPAHLVTLLGPPEQEEILAHLLMRETGTFGVRVREQRRYTLQRSWETAKTPYGEIRLKIGKLGEEIIAESPEYDDCRAAAKAHDVPLRLVYNAAQQYSAGRR